MMSGFKTVFPYMAPRWWARLHGGGVVGVRHPHGLGALAGILGESTAGRCVTNDILARSVVFGIVILIIIFNQGLLRFQERDPILAKRNIEFAI